MEAPLAGALALLWSTGCAAPARATFDDALRAEGVRSIAVEERFIVYSPYAGVDTQRYVAAANRALDDLEQGMGIPLGAPVIVVLVPRPVEGMVVTVTGDTLHFEGAPERPSDRGVLGVAIRSGERDTVVVYVGAETVHTLSDGRTLTGSFTFPEDLLTMRHELAHLVAERAGLEGPKWLDEGLAQLFEHGRLENGALVTERDALPLAAARELYAETSLDVLLGWEERYDDMVAGRVLHAGRPLAHALAVYVVEGDEGSLPERLRRLAALGEADVLALEPELRAWIEAGMPPPAPAPVP
jgi:hypothetical protein